MSRRRIRGFRASLLTSFGNSCDYLEEKHSWRSSGLNRLSPDLVVALAAALDSGLEGVSFPVNVEGVATPSLNDVVTNSDPDWLNFVAEISNERKVSFQALTGWLADNQLSPDVLLIFAGALSVRLPDNKIKVLAEKDDISISKISLSNSGSLELDIVKPTVLLPELIDQFHLDGSGQIVAVIDGEIDIAHPALSGRVIRKANFSSSEWDSTNSIADEIGKKHGTAVAGIIAGNGAHSPSGLNLSGIAPGCVIWNYKIAPLQNNGAFVARAIEQALIDGARVANLSWGQKIGDRDGNSVWSRTVDEAFSRGMIVIKSAGNDGPSASSITIPSDAHFVLSVGATNRQGNTLHSGSSRGPCTDGRPKPDLIAPGGGTNAPSSPSEYEPVPTPGTSFASPIVAATAALLLQKKPTATSLEIRNALIAGTTPLVGLSPNEQGSGLVNTLKSLEALL